MRELHNIHARFEAQNSSQKMLRAVEMLHSPDLTARLAGLALLGAPPASQDGAIWREAVEDILCAFVRARTQMWRGLAHRKLETDTQNALTALAARPRNGAQPLDLHGACLREVVWPKAQLRGAFLYDCDLEGALLAQADLRGAWLLRANLRRANLDGADLRATDVSGARGLERAQLQSAIWDETTRWPPDLRV